MIPDYCWYVRKKTEERLLGIPDVAINRSRDTVRKPHRRDLTLSYTSACTNSKGGTIGWVILNNYDKGNVI